MVDFSNIFNNDKSKEDNPEKQPQKNTEKNPIDLSGIFEKPKEKTPQLPPEPVKKVTPQNDINTAKIPDDPSKTCEAKSLYQLAANLSEKLFEGSGNITLDEAESILLFVESIIDAIHNNNVGVISCVFRYAPSEKISPYALKFLNVCILSIEIGIELGYDDTHLTNLGVAAYLHDIGLKKYLDIINQPRKLTPQEKTILSKSIETTKEILAPVKDKFSTVIFDIIDQCAKLTTTSKTPASPLSAKGEIVAEAAQIIMLADAYEALTHPRPYRPKHTPLEAIKIILQDKVTFDPRLAKILLERIGLYPKGTFVVLSTKETAQVLEQNTKMPTSPIVKIIYDIHGKKIDNGRELNLSKEAEIFIEKPL